MKMKFFKCPICGQIIAMVEETGVPVFCCGKPMDRIVSEKTEGSAEKHIPIYKVVGNTLYVNVGSQDHPMERDHYIEWIAVETNNGNQRKLLYPGMEPKACFALCGNDEVEAVYAYCNIHNLWETN